MKEKITLRTLEIKRERLRGIRPLTKEEVKIKGQIDMIKYFNKVINEVPYLDNDGNVIRFIEDLKREINGETFEEHIKHCGCCDELNQKSLSANG